MYCTRCGTWTPDDGAACAQCGAALAPAAVEPPSPAATSAAPPVAFAAPAVPGTPGPAGLPRSAYGGFWRRFAAAMVDSLVLFFPDAILRVLLGVPSAVTLRPLLENDMPRLMIVYLVTTFLWWLYSATLESSAAQGTLGQQLLGLRVTTTAGARISFARATGRYLAQWLSVLTCGLGYLFNLWTSRRQTLHDLVAGCVLVRTSAAPAASPELAGGSAS